MTGAAVMYSITEAKKVFFFEEELLADSSVYMHRL